MFNFSHNRLGGETRFYFLHTATEYPDFSIFFKIQKYAIFPLRTYFVTKLLKNIMFKQEL